jgi:hypothetical protein
MPCRMIGCVTNNELEFVKGSTHHLIIGTILTFAWRK